METRTFDVDAAAVQQLERLTKDGAKRLDVRSHRRPRQRGRAQHGRVRVITCALEQWRVPIGAEHAAQELANDRDGTRGRQEERREFMRLRASLSRLHARQRRHRERQLGRQHDAPFEIVMPARNRPGPGQKLDVREDRLPVESLSGVHAALTIHADGAVTQEMAHESCERQCLRTLAHAI